MSMKNKRLVNKLLSVVKGLVMSSYLVSLYEQAPEENKLASVLIAREVLVRVSEIIVALQQVYEESKDVQVKQAIGELRVARKLLSEIAYGDLTDPRVLRAHSFREVNYPLLLDDAHHHIHNSIIELCKSKQLDERLKEILKVLEKARRDTSPMELYKRAYQLLKKS